jgi:exonuclease SbcD
MFRFLHTADLHLDSPLRGLAMRDEAAAQTLLGASRRAFESLVDLALAEPVDFVVIAGDVYDRDWKGYETGLFFRRGMARLASEGVPVYLVAGNHDAASVISRRLTLPENVRVFSSRAPETHQPEPWPVAIHGMSFPNRAVEENLVPRYPDPVPGKFNLGLLHTSLAGSEGHDTYAPCTVAELVAKGYDYWALGHIHQPQIVHESPWIVYPGNLQGRHIRENGPRGCRIVDVDDALEVTACEWHALDVARWETVAVALDGAASLDEALPRLRAAVASAVEGAEGRLLALRLVLSGATAAHGELCSHFDRLEAEALSIADEFGEGAVWLERVKLATRPLVSLAELAERDELTRVIVEAARTPTSGPGDADADAGAGAPLPPEALELLALLPSEVKAPLEEQWRGDALAEIHDEARALILDRLVSKGGDA